MLAHHDALLRALQDLAGEALASDSHGNCLIEIDDIMLTLKSREHALIVQAELGNYIANHTTAFWRHLMECNAPLIEANRGALGVADDENTIVLVNHIDTTSLPDEVVSELLSATVEQAQRLIALFEQELPDPFSTDTPAQQQTGTPAPEPLPPSFISMA